MASAPPSSWFAIIDCAQDERLVSLVHACHEHVCLLVGDISPVLQAAAPWLVRIDDADPLMPTWQEHGRNGNWGIMCETSLKMNDLRRHFRKFLQAKLPDDGTIALFRFYDPRVFNTYIRAALPEEREPWFNGVNQYAVEGTGGVMHQYRLSRGRLMDGAAAIG